MKKTLIGFGLLIASLSALSQPYPSPCQVAAVDRYNRVIAWFSGNAPMCQDGLTRCQNTVRRNGWWDARCTVVRGRW